MSTDRLRILILNQYFHPDSSATSQLLTECCEDLSERHEVYVVTGRPSYDPSTATASSGLISHERYGRIHVERVWSTTFHRSSRVGRVCNYLTYLTTSVLGGFSVRKPDVAKIITADTRMGSLTNGFVIGAASGSPSVPEAYPLADPSRRVQESITGTTM